MNYKRKWIPVEPYEIGALESWFSDLSAEGLHLHDVNALYALFEEKEPQRKIYHIEPKNPYHDSRPPVPQLERYEENGWSFVCTLEPHFYIFSAESRRLMFFRSYGEILEPGVFYNMYGKVFLFLLISKTRSWRLYRT